MVRGLRKSWLAVSLVVAPAAMSRATWSSCGVSCSALPASRGRAVSPLARSSAAGPPGPRGAPSRSNRSRATRRCVARAESFAPAAQRFSVEQFGPRPVEGPLCGAMQPERFGEVRLGGVRGGQQREQAGVQGEVRAPIAWQRPSGEAGRRGGG